MKLGTTNFEGSLPFIAGSIFGHRVWQFYQGQLCSPMQYYTWQPGENEAKCCNPQVAYVRQLAQGLASFMPEGVTFTGYNDKPEADFLYELHWAVGMEQFKWIKNDPRISAYREPDEIFTTRTAAGDIIQHASMSGCTQIKDINEAYVVKGILERVFSEKRSHLDVCSCGFYAYLGGNRNAFAGGGTDVIGVLEGYGETVVGKKGFRSRKGRIVALAPCRTMWEPSDFFYSTRVLRNNLQRAFPEVPVFRTANQMFRKFPVTKAKEVAKW